MRRNTGDGLACEGILFAKAIGIWEAHRLGDGRPEPVAVMNRRC
jgi:hypothetical protein